MEYTLTLHGYCGMPIPIEEGDRETVRQKAAAWLRSLRRDGFPIALLEKGKEWEVQEPDDCVMVPDCCGILHIRQKPVRMVTCWECDEEFPAGEYHECLVDEEWEAEEKARLTQEEEVED